MSCLCLHTLRKALEFVSTVKVLCKRMENEENSKIFMHDCGHSFLIKRPNKLIKKLF